MSPVPGAALITATTSHDRGNTPGLLGSGRRGGDDAHQYSTSTTETVAQDRDDGDHLGSDVDGYGDEQDERRADGPGALRGLTAGAVSAGAAESTAARRGSTSRIPHRTAVAMSAS